MPAKSFRCGTCKAVWEIPASFMDSKYGPNMAAWERHSPTCKDAPREVAY